MQHFTKIVAVIGLGIAILTLSACGTPAIAVNPNNPGVAVVVAGVTTPTSLPVAGAVPSMGSMPGLTNPTGAVVPTNAALTGTVTPGPSPTELVIDWLLYGTPTTTPNGVAQSPQVNASQAPVTPTSSNIQSGVSPTAVNAQNAAPPTMTLVPPTATLVSVTNPTVPAATTTPAASANTGEPARGQALFQGAATCSSCHDVANGVTIVGPSLKGVASRAGSREPGKSAADYIHESIVTPNAFIVPGFQPNIMPQTFAQTLSTQQINDLVAYLLTLK
ncbi:MAG: c-type cytochrome [Aggregatilineales bacterium]